MKNESEVAQSCPTLSDPLDCSPPGSSVHGIFQARALEWGAIAFPQAATADPILRARRMGLFFWRSIFKLRQDLEDKNNSPNLNFQRTAVPPPGTSDSLSLHALVFASPWTIAHQDPPSLGIFQARILEWIVVSFSRGSSRPRDQTHVSYVSCTPRTPADEIFSASAKAKISDGLLCDKSSEN